MIPKPQTAFSSPLWCLLFFSIAAGFLLLLWPVWRPGTTNSGKLTFKSGMTFLLLGFSSALVYEGFAVWQQFTTISKLTNNAFKQYHSLSAIVFLLIILGVGILSMSFTHVIHKVHSTSRRASHVTNEPSMHAIHQAEVTSLDLVATAVFFLLNGAVFAFWFNWLP